MRDARVGEHPLHVRLDERAEVPPEDRDRGQDGQRDRPELLLGREGDEQHAHRDHERRDLRRRRHERGHRRGRALVDVRRPHVERRRGELEREPDEDHREPADEEELVGLVRGGGDLDEPELAGPAVDERGAEEQDGRAEAPDDQVLEPRLERREPVDPGRDEHVERDREPLEAEEEREQRVRLEEEAHPGDGGEEERVVLDDALAVVRDRRGRVVPRRAALPVRDPDREEPGDRDEDLADLGEAVAHERAVHERARDVVHPEEDARP